MAADPLAAEWALAAQMEAEIRRERGETVVDAAEAAALERLQAEARWLARDHVQRQLGLRSLPWDEYLARRQHVFMTDAAGARHQCADNACTQLQAPPNTRFLDPLTGVGYTTSGYVYVCSTVGATHFCTDALCKLEIQSTHDHGTTLCPVSGRFKEVELSTLETYNERETRLADSRHSRSKRPTRAPTSAAKRVRTAETARKQQHTEIERICRELVCNGTVRQAMERQLDTIDASLQSAVRRHVARHGRWTDVPALAAFVTAFCAQHHVEATLRMRAAGPPPTGLADEHMRYLARCVCELYTLVRSADSNKTITLRKMCVPLLYTMMRGITGIVETSRQTGEIVDRRVMPDDGSAYAGRVDAAAAATVVRHYTFVPAHPWLQTMLPHNEHALPAIDGWLEEMGNPMKRTRSIEQAFLQAMRGADSDASAFCLASHVERLQTSI